MSINLTNMLKQNMHVSLMVRRETVDKRLGVQHTCRRPYMPLGAQSCLRLHNCLNCSMALTNTFLSMLDMSPEHRNVMGLFLSHKVLLITHLECKHLIQTATESKAK